MKSINKAKKNNRKIDCLLQFHIAKESTKFGFDMMEVKEIIANNQFQNWENVNIRGVMGMATFTENETQIKDEFIALKSHFDEIAKKVNKDDFNLISMGMSGDYEIAIECGSNMVRIGSSIFGSR